MFPAIHEHLSVQEWSELNKDVTITQGAVKGTSTATTTVWKGQDVNWWLNATALGHKFRPGSAEAYALEVGHRTDGTTYLYRWENQVQLTGN